MGGIIHLSLISLEFCAIFATFEQLIAIVDCLLQNNSN